MRRYCTGWAKYKKKTASFENVEVIVRCRLFWGPSEILLVERLKKLEKRLEKCIELKGDYVKNVKKINTK